MIKVRFGKKKKWHIFRTMADAENYADSAGERKITFQHDPVPLVKLFGEWVWLCK